MSRDAFNSTVYLNDLKQNPIVLPSMKKIIQMMDVFGRNGLKIESLPFALNDTTAGNETELQAAVIGDKFHVDLPLTTEQSNYYANILRRTAAGELKKKTVGDLENWINENHSGVWENSWVRFPVSCLGRYARHTLDHDLLFDKGDSLKGQRTDMGRFLFNQDGQACLRIPVSYLLKIALADVIDPYQNTPPVVTEEGRRLMDHFLSDNTSPETYSFHVSHLNHADGMGKALARETAKRFLLTQLLTFYANQRFALTDGGQRVTVFFSPHPPIRQKRLNACISDAFYRELFMNPCLSGWRRGEDKQEYMHLCHQVLSRSQLNVLSKLRETGIINRNLVVLPNTSNISLANNGVHVSLGSLKMTSLMQDEASGFNRQHEKYLGDLTIKILEHFLPLFIGTYSAAPYRLDFTDFHPENVLGFLPHELDFTHLRMFWRRWQKKAKMKILGQPITPFGPPWLDKSLSSLFRLKGDFIPDYRLIDYLVALMSTERSPALNGMLHNHDRLKQDLSDLGIFDRRMSLYSFMKIREYEAMGFSGFESRYYSLFPSFNDDMAKAVDLQNLLHALAFKYMAQGAVTHGHIPDDPFIESERRQVIFGCAAGIPTFFVRQDSQNVFLKKIITSTKRVRQSRRYPGYLRVYHKEYCRALIGMIREDGADLVELLRMEEILNDLERRFDMAERDSAFGRLGNKIVQNAGVRSPLSAHGEDLNRAAEEYYRNDLRKKHFQEAWQVFTEDAQMLEKAEGPNRETILAGLKGLMPSGSPVDYLTGLDNMAFMENASIDDLRTLIHLLLLTTHVDDLRSLKTGLTDRPRRPQAVNENNSIQIR